MSHRRRRIIFSRGIAAILGGVAGDSFLLLADGSPLLMANGVDKLKLLFNTNFLLLADGSPLLMANGVDKLRVLS